MDKTKLTTLAIIAVVSLVAGVVGYSLRPQQATMPDLSGLPQDVAMRIQQSLQSLQGFGGAGAEGNNKMRCGNPVTTSTLATATANAQLILNRNLDRNYAIIVNDSSNAVYITPKNFADHVATSTTIPIGRGIRLNANGGSYEILPENYTNEDVWVASSSAANSIIVIEC